MRRPGIVAGFLAAVAVAGLVAACDIAGATATPSGTPRGTATVTPTETPPPTPSDLAKAFLAYVSKPDFEFEAITTSPIVMTTTGAKVTIDMSGSMKYKAGDYSESTKTTTLGKTETSDSIVLGKYRYSRSNGGKWKREPAPSESARLGPLGLFTGNPELIDVGVETKFGKSLHKLTYAAGEAVDPHKLGGLGGITGATDLEAKGCFWATADGKPAGLTISMTWKQTASGVAYDVSMNMDFEFTKLSGVKITAPKM